ncbi:MAG: hypothetical protein AVDCRST_MAG18-1904 [uncultured Thermomicrobiales bacterium]|uniref:Uncharacterized protein n=1 Tax=uncultured Thermomicrobiales bacterium TaxID=1645740 RepID=A0A6J4V6D0_9BACT|nr:MAG: hypothetical protein AVDCRST_MAG18-1904 [uncultured Thermomicrobiales bacterium]
MGSDIFPAPHPPPGICRTPRTTGVEGKPDEAIAARHAEGRNWLGG